MDEKSIPNIKNFVQYNMYYDKERSLYYQRYIYVLGVLFVAFVTSFAKIEFACYEAQVFGVKNIIFISIAIVYSIVVIVIPRINMQRKAANSGEVFLFMQIYNVLFGVVGSIFISFVGFIYLTQGIVYSIIFLIVMLILYFTFYIGKRNLIEKFIIQDSFNKEKSNGLFCKFETVNRWVWDSRLLVVIWVVSAFVFKHSANGVAWFGVAFATTLVSTIDVYVCALLQIKYARAHELQNFLPFKALKEVEQ